MTSAAAARWQAVVRGADQLTSFEAFLGRPADTGEPAAPVDRRTGSIDRKAVQDWARYDLARILARRWSEIRPRVERKLRIWVGEDDDYFLDEAVRLFDRELNERRAEAHVEIIPGAGYEVWADDLRTLIHTRIDDLVAAAGY
jgi:hypothetical protein